MRMGIIDPVHLSDEQEDLRAGGFAEAALPGRDALNCGGADERQEGRNRQQPQRAAASARLDPEIVYQPLDMKSKLKI